MKLKKGFLVSAVILTVVLSGCQTTVSKNQEPQSNEEIVAAGKIEEEPLYGKTIKFGFPGALCHTAVPLAKELGYFEEEGLDIEIVSVENSVDSTGTGQTDVATTHIAHALVPASNDVNLKFFESTQTGCQSLLVMNDSEITSTKDLEGKKVCIPLGIGSPDHNIVIRFLLRDGVDLNKIKFVPSDRAAVIQALETKEVDAALLPDQFSETFRNEGKVRIIRSITWDDDFKEEPCCIYMFNGDFIKNNPEHGKKIEKVIKKANQYIEENMPQAAQQIVDNNLASGDYDLILRNMETYDWTVTDEKVEETLLNVIEDYKKGGVLDSGVNTEDLMKKIWMPLN